MTNNLEHDSHGRLRSKTLAFRLSPEEYEEVTARYQLCGYKTKQEFIIDSLFKQKVEAKVNPQMLISFRKNLQRIEHNLAENTAFPDEGEEIKTILKRML